MNFIQQSKPIQTYKHRPSYSEDLESPISENDWHVISSTFDSTSSSILSDTDESEIDQIIEDALHYFPSLEENTIPNVLVEESIQTRSYIPLGKTNSIPNEKTIASNVWSGLQRLKDYLIENDKDSLETFSSVISEATIEGCLPFGSHNHLQYSLIDNE
ncbi:unnamed protein product [Rhizopus stolonifer]